jgi:hypothetical protein
MAKITWFKSRRAANNDCAVGPLSRAEELAKRRLQVRLDRERYKGSPSFSVQ